ncbi:MAG: 6-hydroxymethylpterin diphosphokinase MptE-like protein [Psychrobacillus psychrodurans]
MDKIKVELEQSKNGLEILKINDFYIHSKYNPIAEAERMITKDLFFDYIYILFGYGMGYLKDSLINNNVEANNIIIIDPIYEFLPTKETGVAIFSDTEGLELENFISDKLENLSTKVKVICTPNYDKILPQEYSNLLKTIRDVQIMHKITVNTAHRYAKAWQENYIHNTYHAFKDPSIEALKKIYSHPVVLASGGPSLTKQLPLLKKMQDKVIILAAGSTVNSLLKAGIEPDYIVTVDGGIENYKHFKELKLSKTKLLYHLGSYYKIQDEYKNLKYSFLELIDNDFAQLLKKTLNLNIPLIRGGGSVANFAFVIASYISTGPIAFIGQDLAYTNNLTHAKHNKYLKEIDEEYKKKRGMFEVKGYFGESVLTDYAFYAMKKNFEITYKLLEHEAPIFNCTEGGVCIGGINQCTFEKFIEDYVQNCFVKKIEDGEIKSLIRDTADYKKKLKEQVDLYDKIGSEIEIALNLLKRNKSNYFFEMKTIKELDKIDEKINNWISNVFIQRIVEPITLDVLSKYSKRDVETKEESFLRVFSQNNELYTRLLEAIKLSKQYTLDTLQKVEG